MDIHTIRLFLIVYLLAAQTKEKSPASNALAMFIDKLRELPREEMEEKLNALHNGPHRSLIIDIAQYRMGKDAELDFEAQLKKIFELE